MTRLATAKARAMEIARDCLIVVCVNTSARLLSTIPRMRREYAQVATPSVPSIPLSSTIQGLYPRVGNGKLGSLSLNTSSHGQKNATMTRKLPASVRMRPNRYCDMYALVVFFWVIGSGEKLGIKRTTEEIDGDSVQQ